MTVRDGLEIVRYSVDGLVGLLAQLRTSVEDRPSSSDVVVPQLVLDEIDDEAGWLDGATSAASDALRAWQRDETAAVVDALAECDRLCAEFARRLVSGLAGPGILEVLQRLAADRPGPWRRWAEQVRAAILDLWSPWWALQDALRTCWRELAIGLVGTPLAVRLAVPRPPAPSSPAFSHDR